ncbi:hypothetical protein COF07_12275 [Bacillus wiedmannii]|nr:hypothetical protein COF07_12275 [Bacillus wiedmannii]
MFYRKDRQDGKGVACFARRVRKMGECCMFYRKSTQGGKDVACFTGKVGKMGKALHVLQER